MFICVNVCIYCKTFRVSHLLLASLPKYISSFGLQNCEKIVSCNEYVITHNF